MRASMPSSPTAPVAPRMPTLFMRDNIIPASPGEWLIMISAMPGELVPIRRQYLRIKQQYPGAEIIAHPECQADMLGKADMVTSTSGMLTHARSSPAKEFIIVTECGMSNMLRREMPGKKFIPVCQICPDMKKIDLFSVKRSLEQMQFEITVPRRVAERARLALERMMAIAP